MGQRQPQTTQSSTVGITTGGEEPKCTCCTPPNPLIINAQIGQNKRVCPNTGHIYEDRGDGVWEDTGRTVSDFLAEHQPADNGPSGSDASIDPEAGVGEPVHHGQTGTQVDLHGRPFAMNRW